MASGKQVLRLEHYLLAWAGFDVPFSALGILQLFILNDHFFAPTVSLQTILVVLLFGIVF